MYVHEVSRRFNAGYSHSSPWIQYYSTLCLHSDFSHERIYYTVTSLKNFKNVRQILNLKLYSVNTFKIQSIFNFLYLIQKELLLFFFIFLKYFRVCTRLYFLIINKNFNTLVPLFLFIYFIFVALRLFN